MTPHSSRIYVRRGLTEAHQAAAAKAMDFTTVWRALYEWRIENLENAVSMLNAGMITSRVELVKGGRCVAARPEAKHRGLAADPARTGSPS